MPAYVATIPIICNIHWILSYKIGKNEILKSEVFYGKYWMTVNIPNVNEILLKKYGWKLQPVWKT